MNEDIVHIVGSCFASCADGDRIHTVDGIVAALHKDESLTSRTRIIFGQGIATDDWLRVRSLITEARPDMFVPDAPRPRPSWLGTEHSDIHNVLIANLSHTDDVFRTDLHIHPRNTMFIDPGRTERHLPNLLASEACRQMAMTTMAHHLTPPGPDSAFVIMSTTTRFDGLLFPLAATLKLSVDAQTMWGNGRVGLAMSTRIMQRGRTVVRTSFTAEALPAMDAHSIEAYELHDVLTRR